MLIILGLLTTLIAYHLFSQLPDSRNGIDATRNHLQSASDQQQSAIDRLGDIEAGLDAGAGKAGEISAGLGNIAGGIAGVEERIDAGQDRLKDSASLIDEGKSILGAILERGQVGN